MDKKRSFSSGDEGYSSVRRCRILTLGLSMSTIGPYFPLVVAEVLFNVLFALSKKSCRSRAQWESMDLSKRCLVVPRYSSCFLSTQQKDVGLRSDQRQTLDVTELGLALIDNTIILDSRLC